MTKAKRHTTIAVPILSTAAALGDFAALILMVRSSATMPLTNIMLLAEMVLIACAVAQWVLYFRGYIAKQIAERLPDVPDKA